MCTVISAGNGNHYFGRNLDVESHYNEAVTVIPRNYPLSFKKEASLNYHHAFMGVATVIDNTPLFYDGVNEYGLAIAGLNFPKEATYFEPTVNKDNITPFEIIPWILGRAKNLNEATALFEKMNVININFNSNVKNTPMHWYVADKSGAITVEPVKDGLKIYENNVGVMTNCPPFPDQLMHLNDFSYLSPRQPENNFSKNIHFNEYCRGLGSMGLPGDFSSKSRFVRAAFLKENLIFGDNPQKDVFHILDSVAFVKGAVVTNEGGTTYTVYSSVIDTENLIYYYKTYDGNGINSLSMNSADLNSDKIYSATM